MLAVARKFISKTISDKCHSKLMSKYFNLSAGPLFNDILTGTMYTYKARNKISDKTHTFTA